MHRIPNRTAFVAHDVIRDVWSSLKLPPHALESLELSGDEAPGFTSAFKIGILAQSSIALSALGAALLDTQRRGASQLPRVRVPLDHAMIEFKSEHWNSHSKHTNTIGGLHRTKDGWVRIHDLFPNHRQGTLELLGLPSSATREDVAAKTALWKAVDLETAGTAEGKVAIYALRSFDEWDVLPQARAIDVEHPILMQRIKASVPKPMTPDGGLRCLRGIRVVEMSRVIAAPVAGKTLAAHGADVLWVTSPNLPDAPDLDREFSRGKRSVHLDIKKLEDKEKLLSLLRTCDVFIQGYRPGSLAAQGVSPEELAEINPHIVCANLSAFGPTGPWAGRRGFDSLVQTCSGMNVHEAEHAGKGEAARPMPCQALDHASGYLLAAGVAAALYHRSTSGGAWRVDVSLAGTMAYLRSLGRHRPETTDDPTMPERVPVELMETRETAWGTMAGVRHSASVDGREVGWQRGPSVPGSDEPAWL